MAKNAWISFETRHPLLLLLHFTSNQLSRSKTHATASFSLVYVLLSRWLMSGEFLIFGTGGLTELRKPREAEQYETDI
jgi:hypothetical protein